MSGTGNGLPNASGRVSGTAPGALLARARETQNLSMADAARQLKLSVWQVEALETGLYDRLPGPVFVRGFIRNYARLVKLDPEELAQLAGDSWPQSAPRPETPPSQNIPFPAAHRPRWRNYAIAATAIAGALAVYEFYFNESGTVLMRPVEVTPAGVTVVSQPQRAAGAVPEQAAAQTGVPAITTAAAAATIVRDAPPADAGSALSSPGAAPQTGKARARLVFDDESWVEIRDRDGKVIFSQLNRAGTSRIVNGLPPLSLVVGNAPGVRLIYNDQPVDLAPHTRIDVARLTLE